MNKLVLISILSSFTFHFTGAQPLTDNTILQKFVILDEDNTATPVRIRITDLGGNYIAPTGHDPHFPITFSQDQVADEGDVMLADNRRFAYVSGHFEVELAIAESYVLEAIKGFVYQRVKDTIKINGDHNEIKISLTRAIDPPLEGWHSGDIHVHHINPE